MKNNGAWIANVTRYCERWTRAIAQRTSERMLRSHWTVTGWYCVDAMGVASRRSIPSRVVNGCAVYVSESDRLAISTSTYHSSDAKDACAKMKRMHCSAINGGGVGVRWRWRATR